MVIGIVCRSFNNAFLADFALIHLDDGLHLLLPLQRTLYVFLNSGDVLRSFLEVHHQFLTVYYLSLLLGILDLQT